MATTDHTSPDYSLTASTEHPTNPLGRPLYLSDDTQDPDQRLLARLAGIQMSINMLNDLLANSEAFRDQQTCGQETPPGEWPLPPTYVEGLFVAVHFLCEYAESLSLRALSEAEQADA
jgi:hypothetical protein